MEGSSFSQHETDGATFLSGAWCPTHSSASRGWLSGQVAIVLKMSLHQKLALVYIGKVVVKLRTEQDLDCWMHFLLSLPQDDSSAGIHAV